jgi:hypothetical protein
MSTRKKGTANSRAAQFYCACISVLLFFLTSCDKNETAISNPYIPAKSKSAILIGNEGQYLHGDASLTLIDITNNKSYADIFKSVNSRSLGDIMQSINEYNNEVYLLVNNSKKIEIIDPKDYHSIATINGFSSPRYIEFQNSHTAYVSEFYSNSLKILNPSTRQITGSIDCPGWQEEIRLSGTILYITDYQNNRVLLWNTTSSSFIDTIITGKNPVSLALDKSGKLWIGCNGTSSEKASVLCYDPLKDSLVYQQLLDRFVLRRIVANKEKDFIYIVSDDLLMIHATDSEYSMVKILPALGSGHAYYAAGIDPVSGDLYLSDARDFQQKSTIYHYTNSMQYIGQFQAGINAGSFYFLHD